MDNPNKQTISSLQTSIRSNKNNTTSLSYVEQMLSNTVRKILEEGFGHSTLQALEFHMAEKMNIKITKELLVYRPEVFHHALKNLVGEMVAYTIFNYANSELIERFNLQRHDNFKNEGLAGYKHLIAYIKQTSNWGPLHEGRIW